MSNTGNGSGAEWHHAKIRDYFNRCFDEIYTPFLEVSDDLVTALTAFVNDDEHKGAEAEQSKLFVNDMQIVTVQDTIYDIQLLCGLMQGEGFEEGVPLLEKFLEEVDEDENTVIKSLQIEKVIKDFKEYSKGFKAIYPEVKSLRDEVVSVANGCDVISRSVWTDPDPKPSEDNFDAFVDLEGESGSIQVFYKKFCDFLETHNDDISRSNFKTILDGIVNNLNSIINGLGDGSFDITRYTETKDNIEWTNVKELLDGDDFKKYLEYMKSYSLYLQGLIPRCQVYKYDPVNMSSGNYINDRTDLTVGGRHPIELMRFYNAQSDLSGILGKGWTTGFDVKLRKNGDDDTLKAVYSDGHEGIYKKEAIRGEEVYVEIHGEEGIVREVSDGHVLVRDDGSYEKYDAEGFLVAMGDIRSNRDYNDAKFPEMFEACRDEHTKISYETFILGGKKITRPVKIETREGTYISLFYNTDGTLKEAKDNAGRTISYEYEHRGQEHFLTVVIYPGGGTRKYEYNEQGLISSVTRPEGVVGLINEYDEKRRVIHQSFPDGSEMSYSYDDEEHITTATEQNGCVVEYLSDEIGRHVGTRYKGVVPGSTTQDVTDTETVIEERFTYNERNQKTSVTDKNGHVTRYSYDNRGHLTGIVGPEGINEHYTYNADGKLYSKKDSEGNVTRFTYDMEGNLYCIKDPLGGKVRFDYEDGKIISIRDDDGNETALTYDKRGNIASVTDPNGVTIKYECDMLGRVIATEDAEGNRTTYDLDVDGNLKRVVDPEGNVTAYEYTALGKVSAVINPDGTKRSWEYNANGKPAVFTDEDNRTTKIYYNLSGEEERIVLPNSGSVSYEYDLLGNLIKMTDPDGRVTAYTHDKAGNILTVKKGDNAIEEAAENISVTVAAYTYDALGRVKTETDGNGNTKSYEYDKNGNLIRETNANGGAIVREYDRAGRLIEETDALGRETLYTYDKSGNIKTITDSNGVVTENIYKGNKPVKVIRRAGEEEHVVTSYEYDALGRIKSGTQEDGFVVTMEYNKKGDISKVMGSDGRFVSYKYDPCGRIIEADDGGNITSYTYTGTGKLKSVTDPLGNRAEYTYNELDLLSRVVRLDADGLLHEENGNGSDHVTNYEYSLSGRLISITDALGQKDHYSYDVLGNVRSHTDRDGYETVYTRDGNGNVTGINYSDGKSVKMRYNALNILEEVKDHLGLTKIESDILGRTVSVTDFKGRTVGYEYGPYDMRSAVIYPDGKRAEYTYDAFGRLVSLSGAAEGENVTYSYDKNGRLFEKLLPNGVKTQYDYYQGGQLKAMESSDRQGVLDKYVYSYDEDGLISGINRNRRGLDAVSGQYDYKYDALGRLISTLHDGVLKSTYQYDAFGNRTSLIENNSNTSYKYDALDRLVEAKELNNSQVITKTYAYDKRGNQTKEFVDGLLKKTFTFDATNMLSKVTDTEKGELENQYNGLGFRVATIRPEEKTEYLCDLSKDCYNLLERTVNGEKESFIYDNNVVSMSKGGNSYYYLQDELGSPMYMTGTDGVALSSYAFDDFGRNIDPLTGKLKEKTPKHAYTTVGNIIQPFAFTGYQEDDVSGLKFAQARFYNSENGRFIGEDQVRGIMTFLDSQNHYIYCYNCAIDFVDLDGKSASMLPTNPELWKIIHEILVGGTMAHNEIEKDIKKKFSGEYNIESNVYIEGSRPNTGKTSRGFADLVMNRKGTGDYYIYEIKPENNDTGVGQLEEYVLGFGRALINGLKIGKFENISKESNVERGNEYIPDTLLPVARKGYSSLTYWSNGDGMIYYRWNEDPDKQKVKAEEKAKDPAKQKNINMVRVFQGIFGAAEMLGAVVCFTATGLLVLDDGTVIGFLDDPLAGVTGAAGVYLMYDGWFKIIGRCPN